MLLSSEIAFWNSIYKSTNSKDFELYLDRFPNGTYAALAKRRIVELSAPRIQPPPVQPQQETPYSPPPVLREERVFRPGGNGTVNVRGNWSVRDEGNCVNDYYSWHDTDDTYVFRKVGGKSSGMTFREKVSDRRSDQIMTKAMVSGRMTGENWTYRFQADGSVLVTSNKGKRFTLIQCQ